MTESYRCEPPPLCALDGHVMHPAALQLSICAPQKLTALCNTSHALLYRWHSVRSSVVQMSILAPYQDQAQGFGACEVFGWGSPI